MEMKLIQCLLVLLLMNINCLSQDSQSSWGWDVAGSLGYAKNLEALGPQARAYILIDESFCYGIEYSWYPFDHIDSDGLNGKGNFHEFNLNAHYVFHVGHKLGIYPLGGINYSYETLDHHDKSGFGLNAGLGGHIFAGKWVPYLEYVYTSGALKDQKFLIGTYFIIRDLKSKRGH